MRRLWVMAMLMVWLPCGALAVPETPYAPETVVHTAALSDGALAALEVLYPAISAGESTILLPDGMRYDDVSAAMLSLSRDYPEMFHLDNAWFIGYLQDRPDVATQVMPEYRMSPEAYGALRARLLETAGRMADGIRGGDADRAEALHDLLCERATYDGSEQGDADNTAIGALLDGVTRCEGYAQALALLYRLAGIPCGVVTGEVPEEEGTARHAWNVAVIGEEPTLIDATWDDRDEGGNTHWYAGVTTWMMAADHWPDPEMSVPACVSVTVNWHARRGLLVSDETGILHALGCFAREGEVSVRFTDAALYADFNERTNDWLGVYNAAYPGEAFYGRYSVIASADQLCVQLRALGEEAP